MVKTCLYLSALLKTFCKLNLIWDIIKIIKTIIKLVECLVEYVVWGNLFELEIIDFIAQA